MAHVNLPKSGRPHNLSCHPRGRPVREDTCDQATVDSYPVKLNGSGNEKLIKA